MLSNLLAFLLNINQFFHSSSYVTNDSWVPESIRWLVFAKRSQQALYNLNRVVRINGDKDGSPVTLEVNIAPLENICLTFLK